ncbi:hypothetical protein GF385_03755 [Candidatus Dependentiae bacterium]|nr:hypothetical protein [Candidatus Dependentiae bacterium]
MQIKKVLLFFLILISIAKYTKTEELEKEIWEKTNLFKIESFYGLSNFEKEKRTAIHEAGHLVIAKQLGSIVTQICIRTNNSGYIKHIKNLSLKNNRIIISLAGYLSEIIFFGKSNSGSLHDINKVIKKIIKLKRLKNNDIPNIKKALQNYINQAEIIILQNLDLIETFAETIIKQEPNEAGEKILYEKEINQIYNSLTQASR